LSQLGAKALIEALPGVFEGSLRAIPQQDALATYAKKLQKGEARIDWNLSSRALDRQVRAFNPWPVAQTELAGKVLRIWQSTPLTAGSAACPGRVVATGKEGIDVATGDGVLRILRLQMPGKKALSAADFLNAQDLDGVMFG
jgi:methionyl-tRNA formyltransferase